MNQCAIGYYNDGSGEKCINNATDCRNDFGFFSNGNITNQNTFCVDITSNCIWPYFSNGPTSGKEARCILSSVT